jgi:hypothetical protein
MKILRFAALALGLAAALASLPAHADDPSLSVHLGLGWDGAAQAGSWIPYQVDITNASASQDFRGSVVIHAQPVNGPAVGIKGPSYRQPVTVDHAGRRQVTIYGAYLDPASGISGYVAELVNGSGSVVARSPIAGLTAGKLAVGLLSDSLQAAGQVKDVNLVTGGVGVVQLSHQTLPASAAELGGLGAVVIDQFDSSTLSQAQDQALGQYVALGGHLVLAAGNGWHRSLGQLPADLLPYQPAAVVSASLDAVLDLQARHSALTAPAVTGTKAPNARVDLADAAGNPLLVDLAYGAGRVLLITFDPADEPVASSPGGEAAATWSAVLGRVAPPIAAFSRQGVPLVLAPTATRGTAPLSPAALDDALASLLNDTPANSLPPLGVLGGLLVLYVLLAGPINYLVLRGLKRRELMWVTIPLTSVLFTAGSYGAGIVVHGRSYFVNEIQVLRVSPAGGIDAASYDAVFSPGRGDVAIQLGESSLASTVLSSQAGLADGGDDSVVSAASTFVDLRNLAIWTPRDLKTETQARAPIQVDAHLRLAGGRIEGTVANRGRTTLRRVELATTDGRYAVLATAIPPGVTASVGSALRSVPVAGPGGVGSSCNLSGCLQTAPSTVKDREAAVMTHAAGSVVSPDSQVQALTGIVDPVPGFLVNGSQPNRSVIAAFVLPLQLESADSLPANWSAPRLVDGNGLNGNPVLIVDYELPRLPIGAQLKLSTGTATPITAGAAAIGPPPVIQVYDWAARSWVTTDLSHPFLLSAGERGPDLVRLRVQGALYLQGLQVTTP